MLFFDRWNCLREVHESLLRRKDIILMREVAEMHGGGILDIIMGARKMSDTHTLPPSVGPSLTRLTHPLYPNYQLDHFLAVAAAVMAVTAVVVLVVAVAVVWLSFTVDIQHGSRL